MTDFGWSEGLWYLLTFILGLPYQYIVWLFSNEDCTGAGAAFPGGCREFTSVLSIVVPFLFGLQVLLGILLLVTGRKASRQIRVLAFLLFLTIILTSVPLVWYLAEPLKLR